MVSLTAPCPHCGDQCPPDAVFCISCGAALTAPATRTTRLLPPARARHAAPRLPLRTPWYPRPQRWITALAQRRWRPGHLLVTGGVTVFGLALLTLLLLVAYVGSYTPGLGPVGWLCVLAGAIHLVRGTRRGEPLTGMRYATLCAALPFALVTQAFLTTTLLFGGVAALLLLIQFLAAPLPRRRRRP